MKTRATQRGRGAAFLTTLTLIALVAAAAAGATAQSSHWKQLLLTPRQAEALQRGSSFHYYDRPAVRSGKWPVGDDKLCAKSPGAYRESILGDLPGTEHPEDLSIEVDYFSSAAAAHKTFRCLSKETYNFAHNGDFDLKNLERHVGDESFGGGGDNDPIGVVRSGRYITWIEIRNGFGPIGDLMQGEVSLVKTYG
jgi:hypothetical protein